MPWFVILLIIAAVLSLAGGAFLFWFAIVRKKPFKQHGQDEAAAERTRKMKAAKDKSDASLAKLLHEEWTLTAHDGTRLYAEYYPATESTAKTVLCVHGYTSSGHGDYGLFADFYHDAGFNVLLVDDRAHGKSEGRFIGFGWLDKDDLAQWIDKLIEHNKSCTILLAGVSMGGAAVLMAGGLALPHSVKGIVADCAYTSVYDEFSYQIKAMFHLPKYPFLPAADLFTFIFAHYGFKQASTVKQVEKIKVPVLFIHGENDDFVPSYMVHTLYDACTAPKKLLTVPLAGHAMSYITSPAKYKQTVLDFCSELTL